MQYQEVIIQPSGAQTATGSGAAGGVATFDIDGDELRSADAKATLDVTAASGTTPSLTVTLHAVFADGAEVQVGAFGAKTAAAQEAITIANCPRRLRAKWTISGTTPSFTFSVRSVRL